ncbi:FUSC family protein [Nonomuraea sp. NPDC049784]|uniref:FUSC family protein n=1 Tax=Nonomuraea sp. NPDC049784 TaxID=3154361 RepID=UPI0033D803EE
MISAIPFDQRLRRVRMPVRSALRLRPLGDIWHKPALSSVAALTLVLFALLAIGRLDLVLYAATGAMCALYGHGLPYAARAKALAWTVLGMVSSVGVALVTAALTDSIAIRVAVAALLAGLHKAACDATRIGPPAHVVLTFMTASAAFVPQRLSDVPAHVGIALLGGAMAWAVGMAPGLVRPDGPERIAVARALESAARLLRARADDQDHDLHQVRNAAAAAVNAAWQTLLHSRAADRRQGLRRLLVRAESAAARASADSPATPARALAADADVLLSHAHELRRGRPLPEPSAADPRTAAAEQAELAGVAAEEGVPAQGTAFRRLLMDMARGWRVVVRVSAGAGVAGWASMALGVGRPYWAVVTAAAVFAASTTLSWSRALQRVVGNLLGVALFTLLAPVTRLGALALIVTVLAMQFVTEAAITRNYWLGSVFVTPMAILMTEFAGAQPVSVLVADRWLDTCLGAVAGLLACVLLPDRRAAQRVRDGLDRLERVVAEVPSAAQGRAVRDRLRAALVELREAADLAAGEWWSGALPQERIAAAERAGHHRLAELAT